MVGPYFSINEKRMSIPIYTGSKFRVITFSIDNPEGRCNNPTSENMYGKTPQENKG